MAFLTLISLGLLYNLTGCLGATNTAQQTFRVTPQSVEVIAGHNITLPCSVDNQKGQAQWTQRGFALGFDRSIPGFPRYQMIGDAHLGVHDLRILDVNLSDDAEYQCQVTPMLPSQGIRHSVNVTILLPPSSVEMVGEVHGKKTVRAGDQFTLTCLAKDAKPAPRIEWYRGNRRLRLDDAQKDEEKPSDKASRTNMESQITLKATSSDNNAVYKCKVIHPALQTIEMVSKVRLDVLYEPGAPEIVGYIDGEIVKAGHMKELTCRSRGGNPLPEVFWYKNGVQVDTTFNKHASYTVNDYQLTITPSDNNAKYECHVQNTMTAEPKKSAFHMRVNFPPTLVQVLGPDEVNVGDVISITCEARNSNPPADVSLVINGNSPGTLTTKHNKTDDGGFTTFANLTGYQVAPAQKDLTVNCFAVNQPLGNTTLSTKTIIVLRPPGKPIIFGVAPGEQLKKGLNRRLTCQSQGGNPLPTLNWSKNGQPLVTATTKDRGTSISYLDVNPDHTDNGAVYQCKAENSAIAAANAPFSVIELNVTYPPVSVDLSLNPPTPREGDVVELTCKTSPSYPAANISLWTDIEQISGQYGAPENGPYGGVISIYTANISVTRELDQKVYTCQADNGFTSSTHGAVTLQVHFAPQITSLDETVTVDEFANVQIPVKVDANPAPVTYTWWKDGSVVMRGPFLNVTRATRETSGVYTVEVENSVGSTKKNVTVNVKFAPVIVDVVERRGVIAGQDTTLECHFVASPDVTVTWERENRDLGIQKTDESTYANKGVLKLFNVTAEDTGFFTCKVRNDVGEANISKIALVVNQKPTPDPSPKYSKAAAELGDIARLTCRVKASPKPTFMWFTRSSEVISGDVHKRYEVLPYEIKDDLNTYESVMLIKGVEVNDHGHFTCQVRNTLGLISVKIDLEGTTKPDPPEKLRIQNTTHDSVLIGWSPGFDGGLQQTFRVRYNVAGSKQPLYRDVFPHNATQFWIPQLLLGKKYEIVVVARNVKGESQPSAIVRAETQSEAPLGSLSPGVSPGKSGSTVFVILIISLAGASLLVLNIAIVSCFVKKRVNSKRLSASSDKGSSKGTTIEMYAPSSYTGTVTGETLSSTSEKSRESYAQEHDSADDYEVDSTRIAPTSTYLIEQLDPPPQYATRPPPHILPPPPNHNLDDPYGDNMRRNQYNAGLVSSYGTLGRRGNPTLGQDHYNISNADSYPRYNYVPPHTMSIQPNMQSQYNGSLRRNPAGKLHFPKDYIRNGAMGSPNGAGTPTLSPTKGLETYTPPVQSPVRTTNPGLSTFAPDIATSSIPIEQRGHLV